MIQTPLRQRLDLSSGWEFVRGRVGHRWLAGGSRGGEIVDLPHCWNAFDTYQLNRRSYSGRGAYRRGFGLPTPAGEAGALRLYSEGFYGPGEIWIDGRRIARFDPQYLGFDIELPEGISTGEHVLAIRLDNRYHPHVLPAKKAPDFILHGGLAGRVFLERRTAIRLEVEGLSITSTHEEDGSESLDLRCAVVNTSRQPVSATIRWVVTDPKGTPVGSTEIPAVEAVPETQPALVESRITLPDPACWSPDKPQLCWAECRLIVDGMVVDAARIRFGITRAEFRPGQGFFLDQRRVDLRGCNRHEAMPGFGNALPLEIQRRDARLLKDLGCNLVRLSHYPQSPAFLDACDELGILVFPEIASWKSVSSARKWRRAARRQMHDLILRDRHHPSIILWGMGNESRSRKAFRELRSIAKTLDPSRPVTYAENHLYRARRQKTIGIPDVWGVNYELDVLEEARDACRLENVILSECCNHPTSVKGDLREELAQVATLEREWEAMRDRPYLAGYTIWSLTDYATEYRNRYRRQTGLFDAWRRPKLAAELFRARYSDAPFVLLFVTGEGFEFPDSSWCKEHRPEISGGGRFLHVFSNCESVRLTRDGSFLAVLEGAPHHVVEIDDRYRELIATASINDSVVQEVYRRQGPPRRVEISANDGGGSRGIVVLEIRICDEAGVLARNWSGHVVVSAEGEDRLIPYTDAGEVLVSRGQGRAFLETRAADGTTVIRASAEGLEPGILTVSPVS